ncbi:MAG: condensation domain-containing protein, partial [Bacteroidota bacterium]
MQAFLAELDRLNLFLVVQAGDLVLKGRKGQLTPEEVATIKQNRHLIEFIKTNKQALIAYLNAQKTESRPIYQLSPLQESMLVYSLLDTHSSAYTEQIVVDFPQGVKTHLLKIAWDWVIQKHSILRTSFL